MSAVYPPERHMLRDLRLEFEHGEDGTSRARLPVVPETCCPDGSVSIGAAAILVDVIGGGRAAVAAQPDWIATADLTLHLTRAVRDGYVEARAHALRAGRTTVVIEVGLRDGHERDVGIATMSFSVLPRRETNLDVGGMRASGWSTMAGAGSGLRAPLVDELGCSVVDAAGGVVEVPMLDWSRNSMGAMQGGAVGAVAAAAAEVACNAGGGEPLVATDLQLTYLSFGKVGPIRTKVDVQHRDPDRAVAHVELVDVGSEQRRTSVARVVVTRPLP
ncbi:MAG: hypothetical protein KatS3mg010_0930 [Acidimicrobiia bacterium]|nr:MAG: hypothetical protein KatS3mg010_0930 [Acidimicrobiia bacterium]